MTDPTMLERARNLVSENGLRPWDEWKREPKPPAFSVAVCGATGMKETDYGVCPIHGGDACLVGTQQLVEFLKAVVA